MAEQPDLTSQWEAKRDWLIAMTLVWILTATVFSPVTFGIGWWWERRTQWDNTSIVLLAISLLWGFIVYHLFTIAEIFSFKYWLASLLLVPMAGGVIRGLRMFSHFMKPKSLQEHLQQEEEKDRKRKEWDAGRSGPPPNTDWLTLGTKVLGDLFPDHLGLRYDQGWLLMDERKLDEHIFLLGATGAGKSETIKRLVSEVLTKTERDIYFVDGKGDEELAQEIRYLAYQHGRGLAPVFKLGHDAYGAIYNGFSGSPESIDNRLRALTGVTEAEGDATYYADKNRTLLAYICRQNDGPPRNFEQVLERLNKQALKQAYKHDPLKLEVLGRLNNDDLNSLAFRIIPLVEDFRPCVGEEGFALEDVRCAIFSMRVQSVGDTSRRFLDFLVEDLKDFVGKRQKRPGILIIDEFGQFSNNNIIALLTLARSARMGVILATQDMATLDDRQTQEIVLANCRTKLLMATDNPEDVGQRAGTKKQIEASYQHEDGAMTGMGSARIQDAFRVDMNQVRQLRPGEVIVIRQGHTAKMSVSQVDIPAEALVQLPPQAEEMRSQLQPSTTKQEKKKKRRNIPRV